MRSPRLAGGIRLWAYSEARRRWPALVLLGVLAGLGAGLAVASIQGATRTGSAYDRMRSELRGADAVFFPSQVGLGAVDITRLSDIPEVEAWGGFASSNSRFDEFPEEGGPLIAVGDDWFDDIERAKVLDGRLPDPERDDEAVGNLALTREGGEVGATVTWRNLSPAQSEGFGELVPEDFDWTQAAGPTTRLRLVGIVRQPMESVMSFAAGPALWVGPGWARKHLSEAAIGFTNAFVRLRNGAADVPAFERAVARIYGRDDLPVKNLADDGKRVQRSLDVARTALLMFAVAVLAATTVLVGQAFLRSIRSCTEGAPALWGLGFDRRDLAAGLLAPHLVTIVVAAIVTGVTAAVLSPRFPIGLGRQLDPDAGADVGIRALAAGVTFTVLASLALGGVLAWRTAQQVTSRRRVRPTRVVGAASRAGAPIPAALGMSMALEPASGRTATTTRPALIAAIIGVLGVIGAVTLLRGVDDVRTRPERTGRSWDVQLNAFVDADQIDGFATQFTERLDARDDVDAVALMTRSATVVAGKNDVPLYALDDLSGSLRFQVLEGRAPRRDDEIAIGPRTATLAGVDIGDSIRVGPASHRVRVVGRALLTQTPHTSFDEGGLLTASGLAAAVEDGDPNAVQRSFLIRATSGASIDDLERDLSDAGWPDDLITPPDVVNLDDVRNLPLYLAGFLTLLAVGATAHALVAGARSRSRDLATLRALGFTPRQCASCVMWQGAVIGVVALVVGLPLGVVVGRLIWQVVAESLSFVYVGPFASVVLALTIPVALGFVLVAALWPARAAARIRTAEILRAE